MNCTKCGANLPEGSVFCPSCGANLNVQPVVQQTHEQQPIIQQPTMQPPIMQQPLYPPAPKKSKAPWIALGASLILIIAIIIMVVILLFSCSDNTNEINKTPTSVITNCLTSVTNDDVDTFIQTVYPTMVKQYKAFGYSEEEIFEGLGESLLNEDNYKDFSNIKITNSEPLDSDELSEYNEYLKDMDGYIEVSKLYQIDGTLDVKTDDGTDELTLEAVIGYCEDDNYYIFEIYINR